MGKPKQFKTQSNRSKRRKLEKTIDKASGLKISRQHILQKIKYNLISHQSELLINSMTAIEFEEVVGDLLPKSYSNIRPKGTFSWHNDLNAELKWYRMIILRFSKEINRFLIYENDFECALLKGDYKNAEQIIDKIDTQVCMSQWSIEKRLLLAEYQHGFKKNKEVLADIVGSGGHGLSNLFSKYHSIKVERNQSYVKYEEIFENLIKKVIDPKIQEYVRYKLNYYSSYYYQYKGFILNAESSSNIIDMYCAFINIVLMVCSEGGKNSDEKSLVEKSLLAIHSDINDLRLSLMLQSLGVDVKITQFVDEGNYQSALEYYTRGNYVACIEEIEPLLMRLPNCFELFSIYLKSCIVIGIKPKSLFQDESLASEAMLDLYSILIKDAGTQLSLQNLHKSFNTLGTTFWGFKAFAFVNEQHSINHSEINIYKQAYLNSSIVNPMLSIHLGSGENSRRFLCQIHKAGLNDNTIGFWMNICIGLYKFSMDKMTVESDRFRTFIYEGEVHTISGNYNRALEIFSEIKKMPEYNTSIKILHFREQIAHAMLLCYLNEGEYFDALKLVTETNLDNPNISVRLRYNVLINAISQSTDEQIISDISSPIFLHQYQKFIAPNELWIAYDNFLGYHGLNYPKEIAAVSDKFDSSELIYFLKNICRPEVYDSSYLFESQEDLENERIEVCLLLCKFDKDNFEDYVNEISEISRNQLIRQGIKQIDESKIYVDVAGIRKAIDKDLVESFNRFLNLKSLPLSQLDKLNTSNDDFLISYLDRSGVKSIADKSAIRITTYSTFEHFRDMVYKIRNMFIASNEYGIDTYLSMRIRHGTLLGEIRSVFENFHLITKKEDTMDSYQDNMFWLHKDMFANDGIRDNFNKILADFSSNIDEISSDLKNNKLQISTEKKVSGGLFDYTFSEHELIIFFKSQMDTIEDHNTFFESIINFMWERTEIILSIIREEISSPIKSKMLVLLSELTKNLEGLINKNEFPVLNEMIQEITMCQTEITNKLDKIAEWFNRTNNKVINEFYLDLPIDAGLATLKRLDKEYHAFSPAVSNKCSMKFEGDTFPHFTYIILNLLHNIMKHSKLSIYDSQVQIDTEETDGQLSIVVRNKISAMINLEDINNEISITREKLIGNNYSDKTRTEDGTGYLKIKKTIAIDLRRDKYLISLSDVDETRIFQTEIKFDITDLQKIA